METLTNDEYLFHLLDKYKLNDSEKKEILTIIDPIYSHDEFQKRMTDDFPHHNTVTLGQHILEVTIMTYILHKKHNSKTRLDLALKIAMCHDLYTSPWQNDPEGKKDKFFNKSGFRHPIEAAINAITWYPQIFNSKDDAKIIIDGIVHHMFPLPVSKFKNSKNNILQLRNFDYIKDLDPQIKKILIKTSNRVSNSKVSFCPSAYKEGRLISKADKIVSCHNFKNVNFEGIKSLVTGKNKNLKA